MGLLLNPRPHTFSYKKRDFFNGFFRFGLYLFPEASYWSRYLWFTLAVIGIVYGAIVATMQLDLKRLVAYSSVAHMGFIVLGTFALTSQCAQVHSMASRSLPSRRRKLASHPRTRKSSTVG